MTIGIICQPVDDFVERAVTAAGDDQLASFADRALGDLDGVSRIVRFGKFDLDAVAGEDAARLVKQATPAISAVPRKWVVNQQRVLELSLHGLPG